MEEPKIQSQPLAETKKRPRKRTIKSLDIHSTRKIWKTLFVKYVQDKSGEYIYVMRTDHKRPDLLFKIPFAHVQTLIAWMTMILKNLSKDADDGFWEYHGSPTNRDDTKTIWSDGDEFKLFKLHIRPLLPSWGNIFFMTWNEPSNDLLVFEADRGNAIIKRERATYFGIRMFKGLLRSLQDILNVSQN